MSLLRDFSVPTCLATRVLVSAATSWARCSISSEGLISNLPVRPAASSRDGWISLCRRGPPFPGAPGSGASHHLPNQSRPQSPASGRTRTTGAVMLSDSHALLYDVTHLAAGRTAPPFLGPVPGVRRLLDPGPERLRQIPLLIPASTLVPTGAPDQIRSSSACPCSGPLDSSASPSLPPAGGLQVPRLAPWGPWSTPGRCADLPWMSGSAFLRKPQNCLPEAAGRSACHTPWSSARGGLLSSQHLLSSESARLLQALCVPLLPLLSANPLPPPGHSMSGESLSALWACLTLGAAIIGVHVCVSIRAGTCAVPFCLPR